MKTAHNNVQKINQKHLITVSKFLLTFSSLLLFLAWLMFVNNNFYPKSPSSITTKIMNGSIEVMMWPITLIILFIFILPIWVTNSKKLLLTFLSIAWIILVLNITFLIQLNINSYWIYWVVTDILNFFIISFVLIVVLQKK